MTKQSRGIRNNNPGNIDYSKNNNWRGQIGIETSAINPRFAKFDTPENGIRALAKLLLNYQRLHGLKTVREIINRWAPPVENITSAYVKAVAAACEVNADEVVYLRDRKLLKRMVVSIIKHENGYQPYSDAVITDGVERGLS